MGVCDGRVALVTGASRGIGRAIATRLAAEGAAVVLVASRMGAHGSLRGTLDDAVQQIDSIGGRATAIAADLSDESQRVDLIARASQSFGPPDLLINNAAMGRWGLPSAMSLTDRRKMLEVNLNAPVDLAQQALPGMRACRRGWILNIGSESARQPAVPYPDTAEAAHLIAAYGATKAALARYTEGLAHEVSGDDVFVNCLAPVSIVLTQETERFVGHIARRRPDLTEPMEVMVEAAIELLTGRHVGRIVNSREILHEGARAVRSLDGLHVLGDALMPADAGREIV